MAIAVGVLGGALWALFGPGESSPDVRLEAISSPGAHPFMPPVGQDRNGVTPPLGATGTFPGNLDGLYAVHSARPSCDARDLIASLRADQSKSTAWATAVGIDVGDIPGFVASLNPVLLRSDVAVTEHGYDAGAATAYPAVLQAGTAVLVNNFGEPTVKCFNGNPLTRPTHYPQASYAGTSWQYFAPTKITYIKPAPSAIDNYTYLDIDQNSKLTRPSRCGEHPGLKYCHRPSL
ncbi:MAG: hypothetical protein JO100_18290 [Pseudonocardia sp.]|nr:hypothetical protein [Pseudonocardia sp.]